ncbi:MAG: aldehyde dehydrogenase family protein [Deltaproteobacteria bacterium]|nr:aldehyde dehydrogenase family protein [Deltaproteobacteria bacterium]
MERYIKSGIEEGAKILLGGERTEGSTYDKGYYVMPTVFSDIKPHMTIFREEIFGPVGVCVRFSNDEEVIASANDTQFGLCGTVWTKDIKRGLKIASKIDAGAVGVNTGMLVSGETPWGGFKESGFGKENSMYGLEEYNRIKKMVVDFN